MRILIFGRAGCARCAHAAAVLGDAAEYHDHGELYDVFDADAAVAIATATGGELPIVVVESMRGRAVFGPAGAAAQTGGCDGGTCRLPEGKV